MTQVGIEQDITNRNCLIIWATWPNRLGRHTSTQSFCSVKLGWAQSPPRSRSFLDLSENDMSVYDVSTVLPTQKCGLS